MLKKLYYFILISSILASGCKKKELLEPPTEGTGSPAFTCTMNVDGLPIMIGAGVNNYYMYSSYAHSGGLYSFRGDLKPANCTGNCLNSLSVVIRDAQLSTAGQPTNIAKALSTDYYAYRVGAPGTTAWVVDMIAQQAAAQYFWNFGTGQTFYTLAASDTFFHPGNYDICLTTSNAGCNASSCNTYKISTPGGNCIVDGISSHDSLGITVFNCNMLTGSAPYYYLWDFGDGATSTQSNPTHVYAAPGTYQVSLRVTDGGNNMATLNYDYIKPPYTGCTANMRMTGITAIPNPYAFSNIVLTWVDQFGNLYTSDNAAQPANSYFQILSVDDYTNNENGETTKKLHVKFDCMVYYGSSSHHLSNADAVIAVAFK